MRFFGDLAETIVTRNRLPHWQQEAATYFVTWRLADSVPKELSDEWRHERDEWMKRHPSPLSERQEAEFHRFFSTRMDLLMDACHGECVLRKPECREILASSLAMFDGDRFLMHSWVAMPNHVHVLFSLAESQTLEKTVGGWKRYSATGINSFLGKEGALWQKDYFDRLIRDWDHLFRVAKYIRRNPAKAGLRDGEYALYEADWVRKMLG